ncbi:GntR family transcriptional regulator [Streptomyces atriruber]|uniref:GntR family transcriptional regulator n=1 Tax=Streptomyces atriruber TaxID=545121 RepID=UPI0007C7F37D|nr:GntR family transcriptional regulator [Streptomyces atriruber]
MAARDHIERRPTMAMQVAQRVADDIREGHYPTGSKLPSEAQMERMFQIGKATVRAAMAELQRMGLTQTQQGKGTIVLGPGGRVPPVGVDRSIQRTTKGSWVLPEATEAEPPAVCRTTLDGPPASFLDQQDHDAISVDRMLRDTETGTRMAHRTFIPLATAAEVPSLAEKPDAPLSDLYQQLADAGHALEAAEHVTARIPFPDEQTALGMRDAGPLLVSYRVISDAKSGRPLLCEELRAPAATCRLTFPLPPTKAPTKRATTRRRAASE